MNSFETRTLEITKRWERDKLSREVSGRKGEESDDEAETPAPQPLSKSEVKIYYCGTAGRRETKSHEYCIE